MIKHDAAIREAKTWEDFKEKGLCPNIQNLEDYKKQFSKNWIKTRKALFDRKSPIITTEEFRNLHKTLFEGIYPWAGELREHNIVCRGRSGAPPENIACELELLEAQMNILLTEAKSKKALTRITAFQHARLTTIQAFGDGNSRTSRAVTDHFLTLITGKIRKKEMDRQKYFQCLEEALGKENLAPLTQILQKCYGETPSLAHWIPSPFRATNFPLDIQMPEALEQSFRQNPEILEEEFPKKLIWNRKVTWDSVLQTIGGKPTEQEPICRKKWDKQQQQACKWPEFIKFLKELENIGPTKKEWFSKGNPTQGWQDLKEELKPPEKPQNKPKCLSPKGPDME